MKVRLLLPALLVALSLESATGQPQPGQTGTGTRPGFGGFGGSGPSQGETSKLTTFTLDFPGGAPRQLITAIEKAMGKPVNAIIPPEHADVKLPPLKMANVNVSQLFEALELTSQKTELVSTGNLFGGGFGGGRGGQGYQQKQTSSGFRTPGPRSDDSIWYFYVEKPNLPQLASSAVPKVCRFYPLTSYLERGLTVDDITTAIETGWKMLGDKDAIVINFHKETKLLIAVGEPDKLEIIDEVLKALSPTPAPGGAFSDRLSTIIQRAPAGGSSPAPAKAAEKPKTEN